MNELVKLADVALMQAKTEGRDRTVTWEASLGAQLATETALTI